MGATIKSRMTRPRNLQCPVFLTIILLKSIPISLSLIYFDSEKGGSRLCWEIPRDLSSCSVVESQVFNNLLEPNSYHNITSPRMAIKTIPGLIFNVQFQNGKVIHNVRQFAVVAENTQVEIDLQSSYDYLATCFSFGSASTFSSNIKNSPKLDIDYSSRAHPDLYTHAEVRISRRTVNSGYLTCHSVDNPKNVETFRIFTHPSPQNDTSPFTSVHEATVQSDETGGFIVPCRTNFRLESPPSLLWKKHEKDPFTKITTEEMKDFGWDSRVGFQFNSSDRMWEMATLGCQVGSFNKTFLPTPNRFMMATFVKAEGSQIGCGLGPRNRSDSSSLLLDANSAFQKARYHSCKDYINCNVALESGMHLQSNYYDRTFGMEMRDLNNSFGVFSCCLEHAYDGKLVPEISSRTFFKGLDSNVYLLPGRYPNSSVIQISQVDGAFDKDHVIFSCTTLDFFVTKRVYLKLRHRNQTETVHFGLNKEFQKGVSSKAEFKVSMDANVTHAICFCLTQEGKVISSELNLLVGDVFAPLVDNQSSSKSSAPVLDVESATAAVTISKAHHLLTGLNLYRFIALMVIHYYVKTAVRTL